MQYRDQLEEINLLTGRIHALSDALEAKGFYPAGGAEIADAMQAALEIKTPGRLLVPIWNWAAFGGIKEIIIWLPIDMIATTITAAGRAAKASDRGHLPDHGPVGYHAWRDRSKRNPWRPTAENAIWLYAYSGQATGDGAAGERSGGDHVWRSSPRSSRPTTIIEMSQTQLPTQADRSSRSISRSSKRCSRVSR